MSINNKSDSLLKCLDTVFIINGEIIDENGEDSYAFSVNENLGMIGVFDGCGEIGSEKHGVYGNKSGAYIASRVSAEVAMEWYGQICEIEAENLKIESSSLREKFKKMLGDSLNSLEKANLSDAFIGFPTTASLILFANEGKRIFSSFIWAGDSRGFVLTPDGLCQVTRDDVDGETDELKSFGSNGVLTNIVASGTDFALHSRNVVCNNEGIFITATDGCFAYFSTPMEFEYMILDTLERSESIDEWKFKMEQFIKRVTSDDYTMGVAVCGYKKFGNLKKAFKERRMFLKDNYISKLVYGNERVKMDLWIEYKKTYFRGA
ncbi:MAG: hypothetical protein IJN96_07550 [Clostridia bacterium]|nr:hypothetical protein [Clostridia bacterium]